ncbi:hypothetical protein ACLB1M_20195 [Escherichia coli]
MAVADDTPVTLISAGVGQTPMLAMLDTLAKAGHTAQVNWFHAAEMAMFTPLPMKLRNWGVMALYRADLVSSAERSRSPKGQFDSEGLMDLSKLEGAFSDPHNAVLISAARLASCSLPRNS